MPTSEEGSKAGQQVPEPANESDFKALQSQMAMLMDMMQQQSVTTSERFDTLAAENILIRDEVSSNAALNASPAVTPSKARFGKATSFKVLPPSSATTARRSSAYFNAPADSRVPKLLSNGDGFKDMVKFSGNPMKVFKNISLHLNTMHAAKNRVTGVISCSLRWERLCSKL